MIQSYLIINPCDCANHVMNKTQFTSNWGLEDNINLHSKLW